MFSNGLKTFLAKRFQSLIVHLLFSDQRLYDKISNFN